MEQDCGRLMSLTMWEESEHLAASHACPREANCPLSNFFYYESLYHLISNTGETVNIQNHNHTQIINLLAKSVASGHHNNYQLEESMRLHAERILLELDKSSIDNFDAQLHVLLWCAIRLGHQSIVEQYFVRNFNIPKCVALSLLQLAAYLLDNDSVQIILNGWIPFSEENLIDTLRKILYSHAIIHHNSLERKEQWQHRLISTISEVLNKGCRLSSPHVTTLDNPPIFAVLPLASIGMVETVDYLLSKADREDLNFQPSLYSFNDYQPRTVLTMSLIAFRQRFFVNPIPDQFLMMMDRDSPALNNKLGRKGSVSILKHVILPALRAGGTLPNDPLGFLGRQDDWFNFYRSLFLLPEFSAPLSTVNDYWVEYYFRLIIESRMKNSFDVGLFNKFIQSYKTRFRQREMQFATFASQVFPRTLQQQCRTVIVNKYLPGGVKNRMSAIESLGLPGCIADYLAFKEFDLPLLHLLDGESGVH